MTTTNPRPLVVWDNYTTCAGCDREIRIVTDGTRVNCSQFAMLEATNPERIRQYLVVNCQAPGKNGTAGEDYCNTPLTVDLSVNCWTTVPEAINFLMSDAYPVEVIRP